MIKNETTTPVLSCEYCEIFKGTYLEEHLQTAVSAVASERDCSLDGMVFIQIGSMKRNLTVILLFRYWSSSTTRMLLLVY